MKTRTLIPRITCPKTMAARLRTACATGLLPLLLLLALPAAVEAQFNYTTNNGTITITKYTGFGGALFIPSTINGLPVTSIGGGAFSQCTRLTSVTIPNSVTSIGYEAFNYCTSLTSVTIPNSVTNIGGYAFYSCTSLTSATIGNSVTSIEYGAFYSCTSLTNVTIPDSVTSIGGSAFCFCTSLTSVTIPNSVTSIGTGAFQLCTSLTSVVIGNSVTNIGDYAFYSCSRLTSVTIPNSVTSIGYEAFFPCTSLSAITVDALNASYSSADGVLFNKSQTTLIQCPGGKAGSYALPSSVTSIGGRAFSSCTSLTSVTIPSSVDLIGVYAFGGCTSLTGVYFKGNAPGLNWNAFDGANQAIVYYLPGTTGWTSPFGGLPTALWFLPNPLILNNGPSFGVRSNGFSFIISWATNISVVVEACTNLANPIWCRVGTNTLTGGSSYFSDPQWVNYPGRFYRLRSP